jgi:hypothetical protein
LPFLKLTIPVQRLFDQNELSITLAPLLTRIENLDWQERLANLVASRRLTIPKLKEMVDRIVDDERMDAAVDDERRRPHSKNSRQAVQQTVAVYTRADALADLGNRGDRSLCYSDLLRAFDGACPNCGMENFADICAACPLPQFINHLVQREIHAPHESPGAMADTAVCA